MEALFSSLLGNVDWYEIWLATLDTLLMLGGSLLFTILLGLPLGVLLFLSGPRQLFENGPLYAALSFVVNVLRSLPFIILLIVMIPFTVLITGTSLGVAGAIPPLVVGRPVLRAAGGDRAARSRPRHHRGHPGHGPPPGRSSSAHCCRKRVRASSPPSPSPPSL